ENAGAKPALSEVLSDASIRAKVEDTLRMSRAVESFRGRPIGADDLQREMSRMTRGTRRPEMLRELFAAAGDDPLLIAECLARPIVADRTLRALYAHDANRHGEVRRGFAGAVLGRVRTVGDMKALSGSAGMYSESFWTRVDYDGGVAESVWAAAK